MKSKTYLISLFCTKHEYKTLELVSGWMAERSKAPVSGTGLFGGVGSNPTPIRFIVLNKLTKLFLKKSAETGNRTQASAATMQGTAIILSQHLLSMMHERESLGQGCDSKYFSHQGVA